MPYQRPLLLAGVSCLLVFAVHGQAPDLKSLRYGHLSLKYPSTWQLNRESQANKTRVTLTPDSMKNLSMKMIYIYELPMTGDYNYARFKKDFATMVQSQGGEGTKVLNIKEISFKDHKTMYAETIQSSLPARVYGINSGTMIYAIVLTQSRHVDVPDPKMVKDEMAMLNSITIDQ